MSVVRAARLAGRGAALLAAVACRDHQPLTAPEPERRVLAVALTCAGDRVSVSCNTGAPSVATTAEAAMAMAVAGAPTAPIGASGATPAEAAVRVFGVTGRGLETLVYFSSVSGNRVFYELRLDNRTGQMVGTLDGQGPGPVGIRIGVVGGPTVTSGSGTVQPAQTNGTGTFTQPGQPFWSLLRVPIRSGESSFGSFSFDVPVTVARFTFRLLLAADLADESDAGLLERPDGYSSFATGGFGGCGVRTDGSLWCWGVNDEGQLGNGSVSAFGTAQQIIEANEMALGDAHACVLDGQTLLCSGSNGESQLGTGFANFSTSRFTASVPALRDLAAGGGNTCGILVSNGEPACWGDGRFGQVGVFGNRSGPQAVPLDPPAVAARLFVGSGGTICALATNSEAFCWGRNEAGQTGRGTTSPGETSRQVVAGGRQWSALAVGERHVCGIESGTGTTYCWGAGEKGQVGAVVTSRTSPAAVPSVPPATAIAAGRDFTCIAAGAAGVWCWGRNHLGQTGTGATSEVLAPAQVAVLSGSWTQIVAGDAHACALNTARLLQCWGDNRRGQLFAEPSLGFSASPTPSRTLQPGVGLAGAAASLTCLRVTAGGSRFTYSCFGSDASAIFSGSPVQLSPIGVRSVMRWRAVGVGDGHACALNRNGAVYCWGRGHGGQLGRGPVAPDPVPRPINAPGGDSVFTALAVGGDHACAIRRSDRRLLCWGRNEYGQLGAGDRVSERPPLPVSGNDEFLGVAAGPLNTCGWTASAVLCWGANAAGQVGNASFNDQLNPVQVGSSSAGITIAIGGSDDPATGFICVARPLPGLVCAGANGRGQLGRGSTSVAESQFDLAIALGLPSALGVVPSAGRAHACVATGSSNVLLCWGDQSDGQVQNSASSDTPALTPVVTSELRPVTRTVASGDRTCYERAGVEWVCRGGSNRRGELGWGGTLRSGPGGVP